MNHIRTAPAPFLFPMPVAREKIRKFSKNPDPFMGAATIPNPPLSTTNPRQTNFGQHRFPFFFGECLHHRWERKNGRTLKPSVVNALGRIPRLFLCFPVSDEGREKEEKRRKWDEGGGRKRLFEERSPS
jgi:hypothetical protein